MHTLTPQRKPYIIHLGSHTTAKLTTKYLPQNILGETVFVFGTHTSMQNVLFLSAQCVIFPEH